MSKAKRSEAQQKLFEASGSVELPGKLTAFLYLLMRDHVPPGKVGDLLKELQGHTSGNFTNGWLAQYADHVAKALTGEKPETVPCPFCIRHGRPATYHPSSRTCMVCNDTKVVALALIKPGDIAGRGCPNGCWKGQDPHPGSDRPCHTCNDPKWRRNVAL